MNNHFMACIFFHTEIKVRKLAKIRNRYNQVPHLTGKSAFHQQWNHNNI